MFKERLNVTTTVKVLQEHVPYVFISAEAINKMQIYVEECPDEVGWLGTARRHGGDILIEDVFLFDQEVHATTTEITPEGLCEFGEQLIQKDPDKGADVWNNIKMWGHSHVNMGITPSTQDDSQMKAFAEGGQDWFLRIIANKKGELKVDVYNYEHGVIYLDLQWEELYSAEENELHQQIRELNKKINEIKKSAKNAFDEPIKEEMKVKVRKKVYTYSYGNGYKGGANQALSQQQKKTTNVAKKGVNVTGAKSSSHTQWYDEDVILCYNDIFDYLDQHELADFSECATKSEAKQLAVHFGWSSVFSDNDLEFIVQTAKAMFGNNSTLGQLNLGTEDLKV
jgi:hypothetical protein